MTTQGNIEGIIGEEEITIKEVATQEEEVVEEAIETMTTNGSRIGAKMINSKTMNQKKRVRILSRMMNMVISSLSRVVALEEELTTEQEENLEEILEEILEEDTEEDIEAATISTVVEEGVEARRTSTIRRVRKKMKMKSLSIPTWKGMGLRL